MIRVLSNDGVHHGLQDVFFWYNTLHVLDKVISLLCLIVLEVVYYEVEAGLRDHVNKGWQNLKSVLASAENYEVVPQEIVILEDVASGR